MQNLVAKILHHCIYTVYVCVHPYDLLSSRSQIEIDWEWEVAVVREGGKAETPLYLLCQHMHSTSTGRFLFHSHHKIHFGPKNKKKITQEE
jgi:hypothetical protein